MQGGGSSICWGTGLRSGGFSIQGLVGDKTLKGVLVIPWCTFTLPLSPEKGKSGLMKTTPLCIPAVSACEDMELEVE